jgi:hypothetical protein
MRLHPDIERVALLGWHVYPTSRRTKAACFRGATDAATCDLDQIERWSGEFRGCNWRVVFGPSGLWGLDCDVPPGHAHDGVANLAALAKVHDPLPAHPQARSGGGGLALFFRHDGEQIIGEAGHPALGIDPRRGRQSQTIPPSRHHRTCQSYRWLIAPWEIDAPLAPAWLLRLVAAPAPPAMPHRPQRRHDTPEGSRRYALAALRNAVQRVTSAPDGSRNSTLNSETFALRRFLADGSLGASEIAYAMTVAAQRAGLGRLEIRSTLTSALCARVVQP